MSSGMARFDREWLRQIGVSLALALAAGLVAFLAVRGALGIGLFVQQQQLLGEVVGVVQSGLDSPPGGDLRAVRQQIQALAERNEQISLAVGFVAAAVGAVAGYLWQERRARD